MAAFPYHNSAPHAPGFAYLPCVSPFGQSAASALQQARSLAGNSSWSPFYHTHSEAVDNAVFPAEISALNVGTDSTSTNTTITSPTPESSSSLESAMTASFGEIQITTSPSSWAQRRSEAASKTRYPSPKRKEAQRFASGSADPKVANGYANKSKKPNKRSGATKEAEEQKAAQQPPTGYVHVRARRGEATDSHSLAERVRREKIREKMKTLQDLVPGGDKVVGKALLLEEIIHYVRSLQNEVQFLSMKLASMDPTPYDFGLGNFADPSILLEELENISPELPEVQGTSQIQTTAVADTANRHPVPVPFLLRGEGNQLHLSPGHPSTLTAPCELWPNYAS